MEQCHLQQQLLGAGPQQRKHPAEGSGQQSNGVGVGDITWQCPKGDLVPESCLVLWVAKSLKDTADPPKAWMI
jgi:hypothetical protein